MKIIKISQQISQSSDLAYAPETWIDARGQVVYIKKSRKSFLTREELESVKDFLSGTVTKDGKVIFAPFKLLKK